MEELLKLVGTHGLSVVIAVAVLYFLIRLGNILLDNYQKKVNKEEHKDLLQIRQKVSVELQSLLERTLIITGADRISIYEFHNGLTGLGGLPFLKMSENYEAYRPGLAPMKTALSDLNTSLYTTYISNLQANKYVILDTDNRDRKLATMKYEILVAQGVKKSLGIKIVDKKERMLGFVSLKIEDGDFSNDTIKLMKQVAHEISILLTITKDKQ